MTKKDREFITMVATHPAYSDLMGEVSSTSQDTTSRWVGWKYQELRDLWISQITGTTFLEFLQHLFIVDEVMTLDSKNLVISFQNDLFGAQPAAFETSLRRARVA
jgi:hypothetical protein